MAELRRAEKLASAKKKLKQFQQKHRDAQSESGRSTPSAKIPEDDGFVKKFHSENGGSSYSLSHSENPSSNISGTDSPVLTLESSLDNLCHIFNGSSQPDALNSTSTLGALSKVSDKLFQTPSPSSFFTESPPPINCQSGSDFFDNITSSNEPSDFHNETSQMLSSTQDVSQAPKSLLNTAMCHAPQINASTPDGPQFHDTPDYSFPDASFSPIKDAANNTSNAVTVQELEIKLKNSCSRNEELEEDLRDQKNQVQQLYSALEDMKKRTEEGASSLRDHVQAIEIVVSEKTELQNTLAKQQEELSCKSGEVGELQGRLRASRHRVTDLEREIAAAKIQVQTQEATIQDLRSQQASILDQTDSHRKRIGDLELEISDLRSKLEARDETVKTLKAEVAEKNSKLSLAEIRIQQLSGGEPGSDGVAEDELRCKNEELLKSVTSLESQLSATVALNDESVKEYQRYVNRLHTELQELKTEHVTCEERCRQLTEREHQLVQQVSGLERQLSRVPQPVPSPEALPELQSLSEQLRAAEHISGGLQTQLQDKVNEVDCLREGLQERALRIQELEMTVSRLEAEWPDTTNLQAAIESDKVAASRAMAQNNSLKKQLEEMQQAMVQMGSSRDQLCQQLQLEQQKNQLLAADVETMQNRLESKKREEDKEDKVQQTERPTVQECEVQTLHSNSNSQSTVSPEVMTKLEEKVRKTMGEIAELSEEKQRLEHLVLQLQGETETIGEYITLYQIQRGMLRQRVQEKDEQVAQLAKDKEALRNKLTHLNCLVQRLVGQQALNGTGVLDAETAEEVKGTIHPLELPSVAQDTSNLETAEQIKSLLTEIGSNNLVTSSSENSTINFHPCPWCSGRLITV